MDPHQAAITLCFAAAAGVFLIALADRLRIPSIALLLLGGVALGPEVLGWVDPATLGGGLESVVILAVAVILFEGGLTLDVGGFRREARVIVRMLTIGVLVTWAGAAAIVYLVFDVPAELAVMTGSLVIVTGPTVVSPLLRRVQVQQRLHNILYWEGVMVDAVGVFVAVLCFEWIAAAHDQSALVPLGRFASRFALGAGIGLGVGLATGAILRRGWVDDHHANIVVLGSALVALAAANSILAESGILAAIVAGLTLSQAGARQLEDLRRFKLELTELGIGLVFVLLAARLDLDAFVSAGDEVLVFLAVLLLVVRPLDILLSTWGLGFSWRERTFLSWLAPRGIVAASMASLFALRLRALGHEQAGLLETLTYAVIGTTVVVQGLSAPLVARALGLRRRDRATWLLIGDPTLAVDLHRRLRQVGGRSLVLFASAAERHATADDTVDNVVSDPLAPDQLDDPRLVDVEAVLALAPDPAVNDRVCAAWAKVVGAEACYRWDGGTEIRGGHGHPVWTELPAPAQVRSAIDARTHAFEALDVGPAEDRRRFGHALLPLLAVDNGHIAICDAEAISRASSVVALRTRVPGLYGLVRDAIILDSHAVGFAETVKALLECAAEVAPGLPVDEHLAEILDREQAVPTTIGGGIALPHVYDPRSEHSSCYVAAVTGGLDLTGPDDQPVRLVFLVVSPATQAAEHLRSLAAIAHLASDPDLVAVLSHQKTRGRLLTLLRERE